MLFFVTLQKSGMDSFVKFLRGTAGEHLSSFWLDAEAYKDALARIENKR